MAGDRLEEALGVGGRIRAFAKSDGSDEELDEAELVGASNWILVLRGTSARDVAAALVGFDADNDADSRALDVAAAALVF